MPRLSDAQLREKTDLLLRTTRNPWIPQQPTVKQLEFLLLSGREAFYGGSAGGGKSSALLMAALQYVDVPGYNALLLRRTYKDLALPGALMDRASDWLMGTSARWLTSDKTWVFPSGARITFGYLESENDKYRYQGAEFQFIGFDELTQFSETQYRYLFSRLRRLEGANAPLRMRSASNPGGVGHAWVRQRFIEEGISQGRHFVPARLADNPHLDQAEYLASLKELDPVTRAQLLDGDWDARVKGKKFDRDWFMREGGIVDPCDVPADIFARVRFWDMAATEPAPGKDPDYTAGACLGVTRDGVYYLYDLKSFRKTPHGVEREIRTTAELDGPEVEVWMEQEPGSSGVATIDHYRRVVLPDFEFRGMAAGGSKEVRANPVSSQAEAGNLVLVRGPWIGPFLDEAELFPNGPHDDRVDAVSGAYAVASRRLLLLRGAVSRQG